MTPMMWLIILIVLIAIELVTAGLTTIWFAGGALLALVACSIGLGVPFQLIIFLATSICLLVFTRPFVTKYLHKTHVKTNYEGLIGKIVRVTERVSNIDQTGAAVLNGQPWTVRSTEDEKIYEVGELVKVVNIAGVKLLVEQYKED